MRQRIRERLAVNGITAKDASRRSGLGLSYVDDVLSGRATRLGRDNVAQLAGTLGCEPGWLVGDDLHGIDEARLMRVARAIEGECRDLDHASKVARLALAAAW